MKYHAPTNQFTINADDMQEAAGWLRCAIRKIREGAGLDARGYNWLGRKTDETERAEHAILRACGYLGIDLGADRPGKLDVSKDG